MLCEKNIESNTRREYENRYYVDENVYQKLPNQSKNTHVTEPETSKFPLLLSCDFRQFSSNCINDLCRIESSFTIDFEVHYV